MPEINYQRLGGKPFPKASLWLAPDHLLCIRSSGYSETYKRFNLRDIQAITIRENRRRTIWNGILTVPIVLATGGLASSFFPADFAGIVVSSIFLTLFIVPLIINNALGTGCYCQLRTAVQVEELPLNRVRRARAVLARLRPLIAQAQDGEIPAEMVATWLRNAATASPLATAAQAPAAPPVIEPIAPPS